jgi:hypothetical protein
MDAILSSSDIADKNATITQWFDNLVASIRGEQLQLESGIADREKQAFGNPIMENNSLQIALTSREMSSRLVIPQLIINYLNGLKKRTVEINSLSFQMSDSKILVWAVVNDDDEDSMDQLFLQEAEVNAKFAEYGFHVSTTIMEKSGNCATPPHFHSVY